LELWPAIFWWWEKGVLLMLLPNKQSRVVLSNYWLSVGPTVLENAVVCDTPRSLDILSSIMMLSKAGLLQSVRIGPVTSRSVST
jgi:hypothetical protein